MKHIIYCMVAATMVALLCGCAGGQQDYHNDQQDKLSASADTTTVAEAIDAPVQHPQNNDEYSRIVENPFVAVAQQPLSTFSIDVDEAAYSNIRRYIKAGSLPPKDAVRIEEMLNYFDYNYAQPKDGRPFAVHSEISSCPWNEKHLLVHIGLQGKTIAKEDLPPANLVFLIDVSGSMDEPNKLPLVKTSLNMLTDQLRQQDHVAIVVYAGNAGQVLPPTSGNNKAAIKAAINNLAAGGSTAGGEGIQLAYRTAKQHFLKDGNNRVILATDGDFNVGVSSEGELADLIEKERKSGVFLTVLGFGMGNYKDRKMQQLADKGNGNNAYIDDATEANKVLVHEFGSTLFTIAKDVKLQVEFNPAAAKAYRLIGYEKRMLAAEDFNNDKKDAGELGAGHTVTALYEVIPTGSTEPAQGDIDPLKYQQTATTNDGILHKEVMTIKLRYKEPDGNESKLIEHPVLGELVALGQTSNNFRFSAAVAEFGLLLRQSQYMQQSNYQQIETLAKSAKGQDDDGYRGEFIQLVKTAADLSTTKTGSEY